MTVPANRADRRIKADDPELFGRFVKSWATGRNYVDQPQFPIPTSDGAPPKPASFFELIEQCASKQLFFHYDDLQKTRVDSKDNIKLNLVAGDADVWSVRLSAIEFIDKSEAEIAVRPYPMPMVYNNVFVNSALTPGANGTPLARMTLHAVRIGEYTIATCF